MTTRRLAGCIALLAAAAAVVKQHPAGQARSVAYRFRYAQARRARRSRSRSPGRRRCAEARALVMPRAIPMGYGEQRYDAFVTDVRAVHRRRPEPDARAGGRAALAPARRHRRASATASTCGRWSATSAPRRTSRACATDTWARSATRCSRSSTATRRAPARLRVDGPAGWPVFSTLAPTWPVTAGARRRQRARLLRAGRRPDRDGPARGGAPPRRHAGAALSRRVLRRRRRSRSRGPPRHHRVPARGRLLRHACRSRTTRCTRSCSTPLTPQHEYGMSMEHLGSSTYYLAASAGLTAASSPDDDARVLYNFAHHIAHAWVPKRAYGHGYFPFQWELAPVLDSIWFAEGFGQYAAIMAVAAGTPDPAAFRTGMLDRRFRAERGERACVPEAAAARRPEPRRLHALRGGLPHRPPGVLARRPDGGGHRRSHPGRVEGREEPARRAAVPGGLDRARAARLRERRARPA